MERFATWSPAVATLDILRAGKMIAARRAGIVEPGRRAAFAAAFAARIVEIYWSALQKGLVRSLPLLASFREPAGRLLDDRDCWLADKLGQAAAHVDPVAAGYFIGTTYAASLPEEIRARFGVYYTPPAVVARLLDQATAAGLDWSTCTVLDPACGGGAFLAPVAQRIVKHLSHLEPEALVAAVGARVCGVEIDPTAAWLAQVCLEATLLQVCRSAGKRLPVVVEVRDSLEAPGAANHDLVIGNPPYGRVTLAEAQRARYRAGLYGHANLYGLFTHAALQWVRPGGLVAYVTPTSFLAGEYFKNLRHLLARDAPPVIVDFIAHRKGVFDDVLQETLLATYRRCGTTGPVAVHVLTTVDETTAEIAPVGVFTVPSAAHDPWLVPRNRSQAALIERMLRMPHRLSDWGYVVSTGPLVWNRHKSQLRRSAGHGCRPLIWAEAVTSDGRFVFRSTKANHEPYFRLGPGDDWLLSRTGCVLLQRTTAKEQARRLIAAVLPTPWVKRQGGVVIENHLNMVKPLGPGSVEPHVVAAFLNSQIADRAFRCLSGSVAVSASELEALPIPEPAALADLRRAVERGAGAAAIDGICERLYETSPRNP